MYSCGVSRKINKLSDEFEQYVIYLR